MPYSYKPHPNLAKRRKKMTPGYKLLSEIKPYSVFPLELPADFLNPALGQEKSREIRALKESIIGTFPKKEGNFCFWSEDPEQIPYFNAFLLRCLVMTKRPEIWSDRPTLTELKNDIKILQKIFEKYPGLIEDALEILEEKYCSLHIVSDEYWEWKTLPRFRSSIQSSIQFGSKNEIKQVIQRIENISNNFSKEETRGAKEDTLLVFCARELDKLWRSAGHIPLDPGNESRFYAHLWNLLKIVAPDIPETDYMEHKVKDVLNMTYKPNRHRKNHAAARQTIYWGPSAKEKIVMKIHQRGIYASMPWGRLGKNIFFDLLFKFRVLMGTKWPFSNSRT